MLVGMIGEEEERNDSGDGDGDGDDKEEVGEGEGEPEEAETDCCRLSRWESKLELERLIFRFLMAWGDPMEE